MHFFQLTEITSSFFILSIEGEIIQLSAKSFKLPQFLIAFLWTIYALTVWKKAKGNLALKNNNRYLDYLYIFIHDNNLIKCRQEDINWKKQEDKGGNRQQKLKQESNNKGNKYKSNGN